MNQLINENEEQDLILDQPSPTPKESIFSMVLKNENNKWIFGWFLFFICAGNSSHKWGQIAGFATILAFYPFLIPLLTKQKHEKNTLIYLAFIFFTFLSLSYLLLKLKNYPEFKIFY